MPMWNEGVVETQKHFYLPIDAGDVNDHINHVAAQFIGLHVYRRAVCGDVDLADDVKEKGLLYP